MFEVQTATSELKKIFFFSLLITLIISKAPLQAQTYFDGKFKVSVYNYVDSKFILYDFLKDHTVKTKYFAQNAYSQYLNWKVGKQILLVTAGAFSDSWGPMAKPVGICVQNGVVINRTFKDDMDGLVIVYNSSENQGGIVVVDIGVRPISVVSLDNDKKILHYYVKSAYADRHNFLNWSEKAYITLFQTQLLYSSEKTNNFNNPQYGNTRERRFLSICKKENQVHHIIVDIPNNLKLNLAASYTKRVLEFDGFTVSYILNLDTGDKNVLQVFNGSYLADKQPYKGSQITRARLENATNLLVYYKEY